MYLNETYLYGNLKWQLGGIYSRVQRQKLCKITQTISQMATNLSINLIL